MPKDGLKGLKLPQLSPPPPYSSNSALSSASLSDHDSIRSLVHRAISDGDFNPHLLSPPLSPKGFDLSPFKSEKSGQSSLSQVSRKQNKRKRRLSHSGQTSPQHLQSQASEASRVTRQCSSMPHLRPNKRTNAPVTFFTRDQRTHSTSEVFTTREIRADSRRRKTTTKPRRWTLSGKARTSRAFSAAFAPKPCFIKPSEATTTVYSRPVDIKAKFSTASTAELPRAGPNPPAAFASENAPASSFVPDTPAMITLRRATRTRGNTLNSKRSSVVDTAQPQRPITAHTGGPPRFP